LNFEILIPNDSIILKFNEVIKPIFDKNKNNLLQIKELSKTRDVLLPKLMSGEVRVTL